MTDHTVEIPLNVRDNSETVTDYAFMGHRAPDRGVRMTAERNRAILHADTFRYARYQWYDVNQGDRQGRDAGHRCRFDMVVNEEGTTTHLFHTEYFTRVACLSDCAGYAQHYASITDQDGVTTDASPYCGDCLYALRTSARHSFMTVNESEPLLIGQHD